MVTSTPGLRDAPRNCRARSITQYHRRKVATAVEDDADVDVPLDRITEDIRQMLVLNMARMNRDEHRDIYDTIEAE